MEKFYLNDDDYEEHGVPSITEFYKGNYPSVVDRYFTRFYLPRTSEIGENEDHLILCHSNRLCLIQIAPSHIAFSKGIESINYNIGNCDRSQSLVKGKHKKGGMNMQNTTVVAILKCKDGSEYKVVSCITGKLIEVNDRLRENISKVSIEGDGYIAVILCKPENSEKIKASLQSQADYLVSSA